MRKAGSATYPRGQEPVSSRHRTCTGVCFIPSPVLFPPGHSVRSLSQDYWHVQRNEGLAFLLRGAKNAPGDTAAPGTAFHGRHRGHMMDPETQVWTRMGGAPLRNTPFAANNMEKRKRQPVWAAALVEHHRSKSLCFSFPWSLKKKKRQPRRTFLNPRCTSALWKEQLTGEQGKATEERQSSAKGSVGASSWGIRTDFLKEISSDWRLEKQQRQDGAFSIMENISTDPIPHSQFLNKCWRKKKKKERKWSQTWKESGWLVSLGLESFYIQRDRAPRIFQYVLLNSKKEEKSFSAVSMLSFYQH